MIQVSWASNPLLFGGPSRGIEIPGLPAASQAGRVKTSLVNSVEPSYFRTIGLPLLGGREFGPEDTARTLPVAIVNDAFAADYWPGAAAVGRRFRFSRETTERVIIGVAKTAALNFLGEPPQPCVYLPAAQAPQRSMVLYIRTAADPKPVLGLAQRTLRDVDPQVPPSDPTTVRELMDNNLWIARVLVWLLAVLGLLGLALASLGLYGVMAYSVGGRRRETGVRMALGATTGRIMRMVLRQGLSVVAAGAAVGLALGLLAGHALSAAFSVVPPADLASFSGACAILLAAAALACWIPGRRASRVDPATALRES